MTDRAPAPAAGALVSPVRELVSPVRELADRLHAVVLAAEPFAATRLGVPGHDAEVPDLSRDAEQALADRVRSIGDEADRLPPADLSGADRVTLAAVRHAVGSQLAQAEARSVEHTVSTLSDGPSALFGLAAQTRLVAPSQAADHLERTAGFVRYLDTHVERLRSGAAAGRTPVATLVAVAVAQVDGYLAGGAGGGAGGGGDVLADVAPPAGWDGGNAWVERLRSVVSDEVRPALLRWREAVAALPTRPDERCGLVHLPDGARDYDRLVAVNTTLPLTATQVYEQGRTAVAELVEQMSELGAELGLRGFPAVREALRASGSAVEPEVAMRGAREAVRRAEAAVAGSFPEPLPAPCEVAAMSEHLGRAGMPPHYTPPRPDGGAVGTYWFNTEQPGPGSGWDLESTAFHEAVPGHHLHLSRSLRLTGVPALQAMGFVTAHTEGWGLYAEVLAGELGLYSSVEARIGALGAELFRACRLVVDTGIHALGWSRARAVAELSDTALPLAFAASEVNRYIGIPGQALAYLIGQRELLRLRADARARLGDRFTLTGFHAAVLDSGMLPLPAVGAAVDAWIAGSA